MSGHSCFVANLLCYLGAFKVDDFLMQTSAISLKEFLEVSGRRK